MKSLSPLLLSIALGSAASGILAAPPAELALPVRFLDSATGFAVQPDSVEVRRVGRGQDGKRWTRAELPSAGRAALELEHGRHRLTAISAKYFPVSGVFEMSPGNPYNVVFHLDPVELPESLRPEMIAGLHREGEMLIQGFVADEDTGEPLPSVRVRSFPSGWEARTDAGGFFRLHIPVPEDSATTPSPVRLLLDTPGYGSHERDHLEVWSRGDWTYRLSLVRGGPREVVDERTLRRRGPSAAEMRSGISTKVKTSERAAADAAASATSATSLESASEASLELAASTPPPIRVPINIRVLRKDGTTIDYVSLQTYCQRSLPSEWYASWGSIGPGNSGTNCLLAGAVAIRTYAIGYINNPYNANADICGTTSCQAYDHTRSDARTTAAVNHTLNHVMRQPGAARIGFKITEYSAENNSLGFSCGDGYTQPTGGCIYDPVCTGETRFGHGRGMCQWGTARWATGRRMASRTTSDAVTNNFPLQNWVWLCEHYYPNLELVQGAPLAVNDYAQVLGTSSLTVRRCADGGISSGTGCPQITTKASGATGLIIGGPVRVTSDGVGYTWWQVQWFDGSSTIGWSPENWLERITEPLNVPPVLAPIANKVVNEGALLTLTNTASASANADTPLTDFEGFASGTSSGTVLFRQPTFSGSTGSFLDASPNSTTVTGTVPPGNTSARVLRANWSWNTTVNAWLRLTTSGTANLPNPVIDVNRKVVFDIYTDKDLKVALGVRETDNPAGTPIGSNGGTTGGIEFVGVTNVSSSQPQATRTVTAGNWTTLVFDLPNEPVRNFNSGNGVLSTATGLGVLEHLAFVPAAGAGAYDVYLDNLIVSTPKVLTYSLSNAPAGATIHSTTGVFTWTPAEAQGPGVYHITVRVTDNNLPPLSDAKTFQVTVNEVNTAPVLAAIAGHTVHAGTTVIFTNTATDTDLPANTLTFGLASATAAGATVHPASGVFSWPTTGAWVNTTNSFAVFVVDNGVPPLGDTNTFSVVVHARPQIQSLSATATNFTLDWSAIPGTAYRVQFKTNVEDAVWWSLAPDVIATNESASLSDTFTAPRRFYRVLVLSP